MSSSNVQFEVLLEPNSKRLGVEFVQKCAPYFVKRVLEDGVAFESKVISGDYLAAIYSSANELQETSQLSWDELSSYLTHNRPCTLVFIRQQPYDVVTANQSSNEQKIENVEVTNTSTLLKSPHESDLSIQELKAELDRVKSERDSAVNALNDIEIEKQNALLISPKLSQSPANLSADPAETFTVTFALPGPLGLEFEHLSFPYRIAFVHSQGVALALGVLKGDRLYTVDGQNVENLQWEEIKSLLVKRPVNVTFARGGPGVSSSTSEAMQTVVKGGARWLSQLVYTSDNSKDSNDTKMNYERIISILKAEIKQLKKDRPTADSN
jgi:hypothetical protein